jgi:hypothetical protein
VIVIRRPPWHDPMTSGLREWQRGCLGSVVLYDFVYDMKGVVVVEVSCILFDGFGIVAVEVLCTLFDGFGIVGFGIVVVDVLYDVCHSEVSANQELLV